MNSCSFCGDPVRWCKTFPSGEILCGACEVCIFFEHYLTLTADYSGQPFILMPWVKTILRDLFGISYFYTKCGAVLEMSFHHFFPVPDHDEYLLDPGTAKAIDDVA